MIASNAHHVTYRAGAGVNPAAWVGLIVVETAVAGVCAVSGAAAAGVINRPIGVVVAAENQLNGAVTICGSGECTVTIGAAGALALATDTMIGSDAAGAGTPIAQAGAGVQGVWAVGSWLRGAAAVGNNGVARIYVNPTLV